MAGPVLLELISDVVGVLELDELRIALLDAVRRAVPADWASLNDIAPDAADTVVLVDPPFGPDAHAVFARLAFENPLLQRYQRTQDGRAYRFSDVTTPEALHATALYRELYRPMGAEHQIAFTLPHAPDRVLAIALSRRDADFSDEERDLLNDARPFLIQAYRNAIEHTRVLRRAELRSHGRPLPLDDPGLAALLAEQGVTARQAEILALVATGRSNRRIADALGLSERTVQKHLQSCFARLGVHRRSDAVELAWSAVGGKG